MLPLSMVYAGPGLIVALVGCLLIPVSLIVHGARQQYLTDTLLITVGTTLLLFLMWFVFDGPFSGMRWWSLPIVPWGGALAFWISLIAALPVAIFHHLTRPR
ncbi:hypothetical protein KOR34_23240 [Posidoniimonas corsicana]|uniref:Uncharacterized protein n=1 Tax=Posidoniimonas corsicana TaxID=1938618 RepID=A0A5C5VFE6_9BACT|nr:hypothetical protein [Posidoniimonas corsicana]TWT37374.1 hypothetical protein KOR34_23240 [Posidoniimonas corsicana]